MKGPGAVKTNVPWSDTGIRYNFYMIRSFGDKRSETLFWDGIVREFRSIAPRAKRKLEAANAASRLEDLRVPPSNRLEKLKPTSAASIPSASTLSGGSYSSGSIVSLTLRAQARSLHGVALLWSNPNEALRA